MAIRTYLYVDGENFATRARKLAELLTETPTLAEELKANVDHWHESMGFPASSWQGPAALPTMSPRPHRSAIHNVLKSDGILYTKDEVYWDIMGLYLAINVNLPLRVNESMSELSVDRAYYYTGASGTRIDRHRNDLHEIGFAPNVFPRIKPDSYAQQMAEQGITVISRPKPMDILLAVQVLEDCAADNFDRCIFVGGDEDYVPLLEAIRRHGKQVWLVAFERWLAKGQRLRLACDRFIAYDAVLSVRPLPLHDRAQQRT